MSTLFDALISHPDLAETTEFLVLGIQSPHKTLHSLVRWQNPEDFSAFGYALGALLCQELRPQDALTVLAAFSTAALHALNDASAIPGDDR
ncbi:MAG: hypothetical protein C7B45_17555 [Sulfobacillus acidophilus]|uniref:Uncharacterized protein n=1 Tax=Sulfobacillus acidophilus TaxID=53633 RepID=A0A2T2WCF8_9FIRM|nr:MAG: hypothetical protein C7B45_17555 [Sulfobacillus acidophilus]